MSDLGLKESDFVGRPGYKRWPAKVWRRGVGYVDSYKWSYRAEKERPKRKAISMADVGEMIAPAAREHAEKSYKDMLERPTEVLYSANGKEYVDPDRAAYVAAQNGWRAHKGVMFTGDALRGHWCPDCDRLIQWCTCDTPEAD